MQNLIPRLQRRTRREWQDWQNRRNIAYIGRQLAAHAKIQPGQRPVAFFNTTTRLSGISQNAAFSLLAGVAVQFAGTPVVHFACKAGLSRCVLASAQAFETGNPTAPPPCKACIATSEFLFSDAPTLWYTFQRDAALSAAIQTLGIEELSCFEYPLGPEIHPSSQPQTNHLPPATCHLPLGPLVLPSLRWTLRRHHLLDDEPTRFLFREYILSAYHLAREFTAFLDTVDPQALVIFNGVMYPEATARWLARQRGIRVVAHEVGHTPFSAFFTDGDPTAYPVQIPADFELTPEQDARLDEYLETRFQGKFSMAGIRFWPDMKGLDESFLQRAAQFHQIVPVFSNVIFDTSQIHANVVFDTMFAWLDAVLDIARRHPETLFVIRAHPDEQRVGKASRESVAEWAARSRVSDLPNVIFVPSNEFISSYELIQRSKFVMVYNSTIGMEAALMGAAVLSGGSARYTQIPTVFLPPTPAAYRQQADDFLSAEKIIVPTEFVRNARRYLYYSQYISELPFSDFMEPHVQPGFVVLKRLPWRQMTPEGSTTQRVAAEGILQGKPFVIPQ